MKNFPFKVLLGQIKDTNESVYLNGFSWDCNWYYGGGYIGNRNFHAHFDGAFLETPDIRGHILGNFITPWTITPDYIKKENCTVIRNGCAVWEDLDTFLNNPAFTAKEWWRIKDLYKQFYSLKEAAETFQHGGHCTSDGRNPKEINKAMAEQINTHIQDVIIPEIMKALRLTPQE
jgi:hypothetical protein